MMLNLNNNNRLAATSRTTINSSQSGANTFRGNQLQTQNNQKSLNNNESDGKIDSN